MKKILSIAGAIALAASLFVACSSEAADDGRNSYIDTYKLEAVDITVKAYPGYNFVSWGASKEGKTVRVLRDDGKVINATNNTNNPGDYLYSAVDTDVKNGVKYTYTAYIAADGTEVKSANDNVKVNGTGSATNTSNEYKTYWAAKGNSKSASATTIGLDHYNSKGELTTALDLTNCTNAGDKKYVISDKNLYVNKVDDVLGNSSIYVSFPTKAYLKYTVYYYHGNSRETFTDDKMPAADKDSTQNVQVAQNFYKMDGTFSKTIPVTAAGTWNVFVKVEDWGAGYVPSYVAAKTPITIETLDVPATTPTTIVDASNGYIDEGKTIRVVWKPAKNSNGKEWAAANYKVYVADGVNKNLANYTAISADAIKTDTQKTETVYYTDYTVADNTAPYTFYIVLSDKGRVEASDKTVTVAKYAAKTKVAFTPVYTDNAATPADDRNIIATFADADKDGVRNDATLTIIVGNNSPAIIVDSVKYKVLSKKDNATYTAEDLLLDSELTDVAAAPTADYSRYVAVAKNIAVDSKVVFLYTLKQDGKANYINVITTGNYSTGTPSSFATGEVYFTKDSSLTGTDNYKGKFTVIPGGTANAGKDDNFNAKTNYTYAVYYAKVVDDTASTTASYASITEWKEVSAAIKWQELSTDSGFATATNAWAGVSAEVDFTKLLDKAYKTALDDSGKLQDNGSAATIAFKFVKTSKAGASVVAYDTLSVKKAAE